MQTALVNPPDDVYRLALLSSFTSKELVEYLIRQYDLKPSDYRSAYARNYAEEQIASERARRNAAMVKGVYG